MSFSWVMMLLCWDTFEMILYSSRCALISALAKYFLNRVLTAYCFGGNALFISLVLTPRNTVAKEPVPMIDFR